MTSASRVLITGLSQHSALGQGLSSLRRCWLGESSIQPVRHSVKTARGTIKLPLYRAPEVELPGDLPESVKRRMSRLARMCFVTVREAISDAFNEDPEALVRAPSRVGLIVGTAFGCLELANVYQRRVILEGPQGASPSLFAGSIHNALAAHLSISFGIQGPCSTVATMEQTTAGALRLAFDWLRQDVVDHVVVAIGDELSEYHPYFLAHTPEPLRVFDPKSNLCTAVAGEGIVTMVLSRESRARRQAYAELVDVELACPEPGSARLTQIRAGLFGSSGQWQALVNWIGHDVQPHEIQTHADQYGSLVNALAFEIAFAALEVERDRNEIHCVQTTPELSTQRLILRAL